MKYVIKEISNKNYLKNWQKKQLINIIKLENSESIISSLRISTISNFLENISINNNYKIFLLQKNKLVVGYCIITTNQKNNFTRFKILNIIFDLIISLSFIRIINIILKLLNIDKISLGKKKLQIYMNTINISYLAIKRDYQSRGYGLKLIKYILKRIKTRDRFITVETYNKQAQNFYKNKCKFKFFGHKYQLFRKVKVFIK
jgi:ribosomal protein S18 acetylase RimI-like enzyme